MHSRNGITQSQKIQTEKRTRIAPTPSGFLHAGNIYSFLITVGLAKDVGASVLLRIDDLDQGRFRKPYLEDIFETLHALNIKWDEGPSDSVDFIINWSQFKRIDNYKKSLDELKTSGLIFACNCSRKQLSNGGFGMYPGTCLSKQIDPDAPGVVWRWKPFITEKVSINDYLRGKISIPFPEYQQHFVIRKKDGLPAYQLSSVIDDNFYQMTHIVRGADLFESSLIQLHIAQKLKLEKFTSAAFIHHRLIKDTNGNKLSKSAGSNSIHLLRQMGLNAPVIMQQIASVLVPNAKTNNWQDIYLDWKKENNYFF